MPVPLLAAGITAGANLLGQGINAISTGKMNRKTRKFSREMYDTQRRDSLADWHMVNQYNSPQEQMKRLKEAGLNPNLVYGNGATQSADAVRSSDAKSWNPDTPQFDLGAVASTGLGAYYDMQLKEAQVNNIEAQTAVANVEALVKASQIENLGAQTSYTKAQTDRSRFDLSTATNLLPVTMEQAVASLNQTLANTKYTLDQNERAQAMQAPTLMKAAEDILTSRLQRAKTQDERLEIRARIANIYKDVELKELDRQLKAMGIQPGDNIAARIIGRIINSDEVKKVAKPALDIWKMKWGVK